VTCDRCDKLMDPEDKRECESCCEAMCSRCMSPARLADEVRAHAARLDRSFGWILATAWRLAEPQIAKMVAPPKEPIQ